MNSFLAIGNWIVLSKTEWIEPRMGARLCLHHRDFAPGKTIFENIVYSLEMSKSCVIVLSKDYAKSDWCRFEAQGGTATLFACFII